MKHGVYLYPASHALSPLATTLSGESGESRGGASGGGPLATLAATPKGCGTGVARAPVAGAGVCAEPGCGSWRTTGSDRCARHTAAAKAAGENDDAFPF